MKYSLKPSLMICFGFPSAAFPLSAGGQNQPGGRNEKQPF
jgi:hypothetical protein